jgi:hypothetical protein
VQHHDRTVAEVVDAFGFALDEPSDEDEALVAASAVMNHALRKYVSERGARAAMWRVVFA